MGVAFGTGRELIRGNRLESNLGLGYSTWEGLFIDYISVAMLAIQDINASLHLCCVVPNF